MVIEVKSWTFLILLRRKLNAAKQYDKEVEFKF